MTRGRRNSRMPSAYRLPLVFAIAGLAAAAPRAVARPSLTDSARTQCRMPVFRARDGGSDSMPVAKADMSRIEKLPVARPGCTNPLGPK